MWARLDKWQTAVIGLVAGLFIGLVVLGWWLWPVQWTNASFNELGEAEQIMVVEMTADLYSYNHDPVRVAQALAEWQDGVPLACALAAQETDWAKRARLISIAAVRNGRGC